MKTIPVEGAWRLSCLEEGGNPIENPEQLRERLEKHPASFKTVPAQVPGNVELDLLRAGAIPDPFVGMNADRLREFEHCQWWYECRFAAPGDFCAGPAEIVFHRVDCLATYWLNGRRLG